MAFAFRALAGSTNGAANVAHASSSRVTGRTLAALPARSVLCRFWSSSSSDAQSSQLVVSDTPVKRFEMDSEGLLEALARGAPMDFYELLGIDFEEREKPLLPTSRSLIVSMMTGGDSNEPKQPPEDEDVKAAYRRLQKLAHPDIAGDAAHEISVLLNLAYQTLSDPEARQLYDEELRAYKRGVGSYDGRPVSTWAGPEEESRAIFVDETACIGCMQCTVVAPETFYMEEEYGRARVHTQWGDTEEYVRQAVGACPVDCIHFVDRQQLPLLEFVMKGCKRECVALMGRRRSGNMGSAPANQSPFVKAELFVKKRKSANWEKVLAAGKARLHDEQLAAAITRAWLALPETIKRKGWPRWVDGDMAGSTSTYGTDSDITDFATY